MLAAMALHAPATKWSSSGVILPAAALVPRLHAIEGAVTLVLSSGSSEPKLFEVLNYLHGLQRELVALGLE